MIGIQWKPSNGLGMDRQRAPDMGVVAVVPVVTHHKDIPDRHCQLRQYVSAGAHQSNQCRSYCVQTNSSTSRCLNLENRIKEIDIFETPKHFIAIPSNPQPKHHTYICDITIILHVCTPVRTLQGFVQQWLRQDCEGGVLGSFQYVWLHASNVVDIEEAVLHLDSIPSCCHHPLDKNWLVFDWEPDW